MKIKKSNENKKISKKILLGLLVIILLAGAGAGLFAYKQNRQDKTNEATNSTVNEEGINLSGPTEQEKQSGNQAKETIAKEEQNTSPPTGSKKAVKPTITFAGQYDSNVEVGARVAGIFEKGGTCTATFKNGGRSFSRTVKGVENVNSVNCPAFVVETSAFNPKGTWVVTVSYDSAAATGQSDAKPIEVN